MTTPIVEVVIATHQVERPVARAISSVLGANKVPARVIVVAHNIPASAIENSLGQWASDPRVMLTELRDGIPSPAGPMNKGLELATAPFVSILGSDDELEPQALDRWVALAEDPKNRADFVVANRLEPDGTWSAAPPVRIGRRTRLRGVADRLSYRAAPLGLLRRSSLGVLRFDENVPTGEDVVFSAQIWFSGARVTFAYGPPGYRVHADQQDRVTTTARSVRDDLRWLPTVLTSTHPWMQETKSRTSLLVKILRHNIVDAVAAQIEQNWTHQAQVEMARALRLIQRTEPRAFRYLSIPEYRLLTNIMKGSPDSSWVEVLLERTRNTRSLSSLISANPLRSFSSQAPFRYHLAGLALRLEYRSRTAGWR